jgi:transcription initiation factor IIF auxiliary subunit
MALRLRNKWNYKGKDRWRWEAFLDDDGSGELADVDFVEYVLHPTFRDPIRTIQDPAGGFGLKTEGWGTFMLKAFVHMKDGSRTPLKHEIELKYEPPTGNSP